MSTLHSVIAPKGVNDLDFKALYEQHWELLFKLALQKTGSLSDATDLVQEVYLHVWENRATLHLATDKARAYLVTCLYYRVFNYFRAKGLRNKHYRNFRDFMAHAAETDRLADAREAALEMEAIEHALLLAIQDLPPRMKQIFLLNKYESRSIDEIAALLSISRQTVKNQLSAAVRHLRANAYKVSGVPLLLLLFGRW